MDIDNSDLDTILNRFRTMNTNDKDHLITEFKRLSNTQLSTEGCCFYLDLAEWNLNTALWAYYEYENAAAANASSGISGFNASSSSLLPHTIHTAQLYQNGGGELPEMQFLCDVTIGEGESVHPGTHFVKTWRIKNSGATRWPADCQLKYVNGYNFNRSTGMATSSTSSTSSLTSSSDSSSTSTTIQQQCDASNHFIHSGSGDDSTPVSIQARELESQEVCELSISLRAPRLCGIYQCQYRMFTSLGQPFGDPIWLLLNVEEGGVLGITQQLNSVSMFGNWNHSQPRQQASSQQPQEQHSGSNVFSKSPFKFDNNLNIINGQGASEPSDGAAQASGGVDEKRPDFYDDMFS